jgi:hypothetical protein
VANNNTPATKESKVLRAAILQLVGKQINGRNPPETAQTYERLRTEGYTSEDALQLIGCALTREICDVVKDSQPFNHTRYLQALSELPKMPWDAARTPQPANSK